MLIQPSPFQRCPVTMGGVQGFPGPKSFSNLELWLDARIGVTGADGDRIATIPDQSGKARDAASAGDFQAQLRKVIANGASPNGSQSLQFDGFDPPFSQYYTNNSANLNPWPSLANGYSYYWIGNFRLPNSSSGDQLLWEENATSRFRIYPECPNVHRYGLVDEAGGGAPRQTTEAFHTGWQSGRAIIHGPSPGTADMYYNGALLPWNGTNVITLNTNVCAGYILAQLGSNRVSGMSMFFGAFLWYSVAHSAAIQKLIENYLRFSFGLATI